ncbi:MFS transporter [Streptomyces sp. CY1]|uniref:MFS transporter n=1 Tax=Streptomyces sp. CY1 TaxID=3388313 RepID=UPI00399F5B4F
MLFSRVLQGLGASVEYTTASQFMLEHEPGSRRRNYLAGLMNATCPVGSLLGSAVSFVLIITMPASAFESWGWRIPFPLAIPIAAVGFYIRNKLDETTEFEEMKRQIAAAEAKQAPLKDAVRLYWRDMLKAIGLGAGQRIGSYTIQAYFVTALITAGFPTSLALLASMLTYAVGPLPSVRGGVLADRYGARLPLLVGYGLFVALTVPTFMAIDSESTVLAAIAVVVFTIINNLVAAPLNIAYVLSFPPEVRSSAAALNFDIGTSLIGSTAGLVAVWPHDLTGDDISFGWYMTAACVVSILDALFALPASVDYREPDWSKAPWRCESPHWSPAPEERRLRPAIFLSASSWPAAGTLIATSAKPVPTPKVNSPRNTAGAQAVRLPQPGRGDASSTRHWSPSRCAARSGNRTRTQGPARARGPVPRQGLRRRAPAFAPQGPRAQGDVAAAVLRTRSEETMPASPGPASSD